MMDLFSNTSDKYGIAISFSILAAILSPINIQILLLSGATSVSANILLKMIMQDPRPYFYNSDYVPVSWDFEYGTPSGHGQCSTSFYLTALTLILHEYTVDFEKPNHKLNFVTKLPKSFWYILCMMYCLLVSYTRIYTGLHNLEQILAGLCFGIITHIIVAHLYLTDAIKVFENI